MTGGRGTPSAARGKPTADDLPSDRLRAFLVAERMTREVASIGPEWTLLAAAREMRSRHLSGFPVVDEANRVVGVLSEKDIIATLDRTAGLARPRGILDLLLSVGGLNDLDLLRVYLRKLSGSRVSGSMSRPPVTVDADVTLGEAARLMRQYSVNRLPVVGDDGRLVGILTRQDILAVVDPTTELRVPGRSPSRHQSPKPSAADGSKGSAGRKGLSSHHAPARPSVDGSKS